MLGSFYRVRLPLLTEFPADVAVDEELEDCRNED